MNLGAYYLMELPPANDSEYMVFFVELDYDLYFHQEVFPWDTPDGHQIAMETVSAFFQLNEVRYIYKMGCVTESNNQALTSE